MSRCFFPEAKPATLDKARLSKSTKRNKEAPADFDAASHRGACKSESGCSGAVVRFSPPVAAATKLPIKKTRAKIAPRNDWGFAAWLEAQQRLPCDASYTASARGFSLSAKQCKRATRRGWRRYKKHHFKTACLCCNAQKPH